MFIPMQYAQIIVDEIAKLITKDFCFIDTTGHIIISTEPNRIGDFHPGAKYLLDNHLAEYAIYDADQTKKTKAGVHTAINFNGEVVGVIGIGGNPDDILTYSKIIKAFTEMLIKNTFFQEQKQLMDQARNSYVYEWLFSKSFVGTDSFIARGRLLGIDVTRDRTVTFLTFSDTRKKVSGGLADSKDVLLSKVLHFCKNTVSSSSDDIVLTYGNDIVVLKTGSNIDNALSFANSLKQQLMECFKISVCGGIGPVCKNYSDMSLCVENAQTVARIAYLNQLARIMAYDELSLEMMVRNIPAKIRKEFYKKIFSNVTEEEQQAYVKLLDAYFAANGSINQIATDMHMHKNTVQYQIKGLKDKLGYDPRDIKDAFTLYLAILLNES